MTDGATGGARPELIAGRYRVVGAGAVGPATVSLDGYDERLGRPVALEALRPEWSAYPAVRAAFAAAAYRSARIQHHQVLRTFDVASDDGTVYIVTDMARGGTLAERLAAGTQTDASVRRLGLAVLAGLDTAHRAGVLHLDLTPANVVFDEHGTVQVARFGILDALYGAARGEGGSEPSVEGGPDRMVLPVPVARRAPESVAGAEPGIAADFWSVGALLYRALTGSFPAGRSGAGGPGPVPVSLAAARPGTDRRLVAAVERALDPRPERRFASAAEMAEALAPSSRPVAGGPGVGLVPAATTAAAPARDARVAAGTEVHTARHRVVTPSRRARIIGVLGAGAAAAVAGAVLVPALFHPAAGSAVPGNTPADVSPSVAGSSAHGPGSTAPTSSAPATSVPRETVLVAPATTAAPPTTAAAPSRTTVPATTTTAPPAVTTTVPATTTTTVPATTTTTAPASTTTTVPASTTTTAPASTTTTVPASTTTTVPASTTTTAPATTAASSGG